MPLGRIRPAISFCGVPLDRPIPGGRLYRCDTCHLRFRAPRLSPARRDALYRKAFANNWEGSPATRVDWRIAAQWLARAGSGGRLLDVGCHDGGFLGSLGADWEPFGIEINTAAAARARQRGVAVAGSNFTDINRLSLRFDAVVCIDVIEHVDDPLALLHTMIQPLRQGGLLLVATGSAEAWSWRLMGARYWYCTNPEHVSFISPSWCRSAAAILGLEILGMTGYAHSGATPFSRRLADLGKNTLYRLLPMATACLRQRGLGGVDAQRQPAMALTPPMWLSARDHFLSAFQKP